VHSIRRVKLFLIVSLPTRSIRIGSGLRVARGSRQLTTAIMASLLTVGDVALGAYG